MRGLFAPSLIVGCIIILSMAIVCTINLSSKNLMTIDDRICTKCGHISSVESLLPFWSCEQCHTTYNIIEGRR